MIKTLRKKIRPPVTDYRKLRFHNLNSNSFKHLKLLLFWPVFGLFFLFIERFYPVAHYTSVYCPADDLIPFCEWFVIPYMFWFVYIVGMLLYTLLYDIGAFRKMMHFIMLTYSVALVIYLLWPTCQQLRPVEFERDNILTRFVSRFYQFDTNTNVCPSIHVIGSLAVIFTSFHCAGTRSPGWKIAITATGVLICISTLFLKQHSLIDVVAALPLCAAAYWPCFVKGAVARRRSENRT